MIPSAAMAPGKFTERPSDDGRSIQKPILQYCTVVTWDTACCKCLPGQAGMLVRYKITLSSVREGRHGRAAGGCSVAFRRALVHRTGEMARCHAMLHWGMRLVRQTARGGRVRPVGSAGFCPEWGKRGHAVTFTTHQISRTQGDSEWRPDSRRFVPLVGDPIGPGPLPRPKPAAGPGSRAMASLLPLPRLVAPAPCHARPGLAGPGRRLPTALGPLKSWVRGLRGRLASGRPAGGLVSWGGRTVRRPTQLPCICQDSSVISASPTATLVCKTSAASRLAFAVRLTPPDVCVSSDVRGARSIPVSS